MRCRGLGFWSLGLLAGVAMAIGAPSAASAQDQLTAGVAIDAEGVLRMKIFSDPGGQLMRERIAAAKATPRSEGGLLQQAAEDFAESPGAGHSRSSGHADRRDAIPGRPAAGPLRLLLSRQQGHRAGRPGRRLGDRSGRPRRRHHQRPAGRAVAGPGRGVAGVSARRQRDPADRLLDRSDAGRPGRHAAVPAERSLSGPPSDDAGAHDRRGPAQQPRLSE